MRVRRVFYIHRIIAGKGVRNKKCQEDFDADLSHQQASEIILNREGRINPNGYVQRHNFVEIISSVITDTVHDLGSIVSAKHYGTGCLLPAKDWAAMEDTSKIKRKKKASKII